MSPASVSPATSFAGLLLVASLSACVTPGVGAGATTAHLSDHFDGERFFTPGAPTQETGAVVRWLFNRDHAAWSGFHDEPPGPPPPWEVGKGALRVTLIGHATTLVQFDGFNVLTDPIYSERCSPVSFLGPARVRPPALRFESLPRIDAVVISHNHYDHLDLPTLVRLAERWPNVRFFVGLGNAELLRSAGLRNVTELDWWEVRHLGRLSVRAVPNQHFANRGLFDRGHSLWTAWVLESEAGRVYFAGDTAMGPHFKAARERLGPMRLAILPIGAWRPAEVMGPVHMSPVEAGRAANDLEAAVAVPMHYGTFDLADDGEFESVEQFMKLGQPNLVAPGFGVGLDVPPSFTGQEHPRR